MLALVGDSKADAYELLFSFSSPENKTDFLSCSDRTMRPTAEMRKFSFPGRTRSKLHRPSCEYYPKMSCGK
jgi:hypothetical protein